MDINLYIEEKAYSFKFDTKLRDVLRQVLEDNPKLGNLRHFDEYRLVSDSGEDLDLDLMICETDLEDSSRLCIKDDNLSVEQRLSEERWLDKVSENGKLLSFVKVKTERLCLAAIKNYPKALQFIEDPSMKIIHAAFVTRGNILPYLDIATEKRYIEYVSQDPNTFKDFIEKISIYDNFLDLKNKTRDIFLSAAEINPHILKLMLDTKYAVNILVNKKCRRKHACDCFEEIECVEEQDCLTAISNNHSIKHMKCRSEAVCIAAVKRGKHEFDYIKKKYMTENFSERLSSYIQIF